MRRREEGMGGETNFERVKEISGLLHFFLSRVLWWIY